MINWFDLMRQAQGGAGIDNFARQFGLTPEQTSAALAALMPAFAMGFQRAAANPAAMAGLFQAMSGGHFASFWENAAQAFTPQARQEGSRLLDQVFGSDEVSRRVAQQAAAFSGVGADILQQMLPLVAGMMAGGMTRMATGQGAIFPGFVPPQKAAPPPPPPGQTGAGAWADLWGQWMSAGMSFARPPAPEAQPASSAHPFEEMMASFLRAASPVPEKPPEPEPEPEQPHPLAAWGQMMEHGQDMQRQYLASLQSIFDAAWGRGSDKA